MTAAIRRSRASAWLAVAAVLTLAACNVDTTPLSAGEGEGVLVIQVRSPESATGQFRLEFDPAPDDAGRLSGTGTGYRFHEFPAGTYELTVTQPGAEPATLTVDVVEGEEVRYEVELDPAG